MHSWVTFTSLLLFWTDAVVSQARVSGVEGQPVTLPCAYSTAGGVTTMCWGRWACPLSGCSNQLIWTDGARVTFRKNKRYELHGVISKGNVSLTIEEAAPSDSGTYCCRVEHSGWFNDLKINVLLDIKPAPPKVTSVPTSPGVFTSAPTTPAPTQNLTKAASPMVSTSSSKMPAPTQNLKTAQLVVTRVPTSPRVSTSVPRTPSATKLKTAPPKVTSVPASPGVFTSASTTPVPTQNLKTAPPKVTRVPTSPKVYISAPTTPATTDHFKTAPPKVTSVQTPRRISTSVSTTPAPTRNFKSAPPKVTGVPASPGVPTSTAAAHTQNIPREATSSSPMQTTETQPVTPEETNTTSSSLNCCSTDGNSTATQPSDGGWQCNETVSVEQTPRVSTDKALCIGFSTAALILFIVLASIVTKKYLCTKKKVLQISKSSPEEPQTGTLQNATAVRYHADENVYLENNLYDVN